jgi:hypothetical protein
MLLAITSVTATIGWTTPAAPPVSPSTTSGGMSGSCIHSVLVTILLVSRGILLFHAFTPLAGSLLPMSGSRIAAKNPVRPELLE